MPSILVHQTQSSKIEYMSPKICGMDEFLNTAVTASGLSIRSREICLLTSQAVWPVKSRQMSIKVAQKGFARKMKDFVTFTKIA